MGKTISRIILIFCLLLLLFTQSANSAVYYLDNNLTSACASGNYSIGNRNCSGSDGKAYKNISDLQTIVHGSDIVYIRGGTYTSQKYNAAINNSGSDIIFKNYRNESVTFSGVGYQWVIDSNHYIFHGIAFTDLPDLGGSVILVSGNYNQFNNCSFTGGRHYPFIKIVGDHNTIRYCTFNGGRSENITIGYGGKAGHYNVIDACTIRGAGEYNIVIWNGSTYNQVRKCTIDCSYNGGAGLGITINDQVHSGITSHNLVEGNIIKNWGSVQFKSGIQLYGDNNTIRRNILMDGETMAPGYCIELGHAQNNLIYNNVLYNAYNAGIAILWGNSDHRTTANQIENNIVFKNGGWKKNPAGYAEGNQIIWTFMGSGYNTLEAFDIYNGNVINYNFIQYKARTGFTPVTQGDTPTFVYSLGKAHANLPKTFKRRGKAHNIEKKDGPNFVDEENRNFRLGAGSPCIDAGVVVRDCEWGDLSYNRSAPDIGAFEY